MPNKRPIFLSILSFLRVCFSCPFLGYDFFPDPLFAGYRGFDSRKKVFVLDVDQYGKKEIPFADLSFTGVNAELYDTVFRLNKNRIMVAQYEKTQK